MSEPVAENPDTQPLPVQRLVGAVAFFLAATASIGAFFGYYPAEVPQADWESLAPPVILCAIFLAGTLLMAWWHHREDFSWKTALYVILTVMIPVAVYYGIILLVGGWKGGWHSALVGALVTMVGLSGAVLSTLSLVGAVRRRSQSPF